MKSKHIATIVLLAFGLAVARAQEVKLNIPGQSAEPAAASNNNTQTAERDSAPASAAPVKPAFTDAQLIEEFGWFIGKRVGLTELEFSQAEIEALVKGLTAAASGKDSPYELEKIGPAMDAFMQNKQQTYLSKLKQQNSTANTEFFAKLKENKAVTALPSGLHYEIVTQGSGPSPKASDTVKVHYTGKLIDGSVFDSSVQRGEPAEFQLDQVIPGWTEGLQKLNKGGKIKLYVPPQLGYGDDGRPGIPPGSTLIFDVELLDITPGGSAQSPSTPGSSAQPSTPATK